MIVQTASLNNDHTLHQYRGSASNQYILEDHADGSTFLIDCGMPSDAPGLLNVLKGMPPLKRVVCTHFHVDHVSGWIQLKRSLPSTEIWFHEKAEALVQARDVIPLPGFMAWMEVLFPCMRESSYLPEIGDIFSGGLYGTPFKKGFPQDRVHFFKEGDDVLPGFIAIHTPGHRPDHVAFFDPESGAFICGDFLLVINDRIVPNSFLANTADQKASLEKIKSMPNITSIWPGHGNVRPFNYEALGV